jgi:sterol desaturase/sphingolipid hydroxylase (fatty acid hydroxylase superfamily)
MIKSILIYIVNSPVLFFGALFLFRACLWVISEHFWRARQVPYGRVALTDFGAELFHVFFVIPVVLFLFDRLFVNYSFPPFLQDIPIAARVVLFMLLWDFGYYWMHRLMHTETLWRTHKWHHSPTYMYWLAGCRSTIQHEFLVDVPFILAIPVLSPAPWWVFTALVIWDILTTDWMHLNVPWGSRRLEWLIVTPRYHHIHHSSNPAHYDKNLGDFLTIWDRLFGTYLDPDGLEEKDLSFGLGETPNPVRLIAGV